MRSSRKDPRPGDAIRRDHPAQLLERVVPLTWIAKRRHSVTELAQRELGILLDMKVRIDQAGHDGTAGEINRLYPGGRRRRSGRPGADDAITVDDDAPI